MTTPTLPEPPDTLEAAVEEDTPVEPDPWFESDGGDSDRIGAVLEPGHTGTGFPTLQGGEWAPFTPCIEDTLGNCVGLKGLMS